ncbi:Phage tail fibers, partial [hydrothermal vent metagenome]
MRRIKVLLFLILLLFTYVSLLAQVPQTISYQGVLTDNEDNPVSDGDYNILFALYDVATDGTILWTETQNVPVTNGIFNVILGKVSPLDISFADQYWLGVSIEGGSELTPRTELTSSAYSLNTKSIPDSIVTAKKVADGTLVKSINSLTDSITLSAGNNVSITENGNIITISSTGGGTLGDNLGNHTATQNINLNGHYLSGNGEDKGIFVGSNGNVGFGTSNPLVKLSLGTDLTPQKLALFDGIDDFYGFGVDWGRITFYANNSEKMSLNDNGNLGIGTPAPEQKLHVDKGNILVKGTNSFQTTDDEAIVMLGDNNNYIEGVWGYGVKIGVYGVSDAALAIRAGNGNVGIGTLTPRGNLHVSGNSGVLFEGTSSEGTIPKEGAGTRMMWYPKKAAFRAGYVNDTEWDDANIGYYSSAMGYSSKASGGYSTAMGESIASSTHTTAVGKSTASGAYSTAMGESTASGGNSTAVGKSTVSGSFSTAMGASYAENDYSTASGNSLATGYYSTAMGTSQASGRFSTAMGYSKAESYACTAIGQHNVGGGDPENWVASDPLFEIGNGISDSYTSNAVTVLKNGNVGIGTTTPSRTFFVTGDAGGTTSWYNDSDKRLKKNIKTIPNALDKVKELRGVNYKWRN